MRSPSRLQAAQVDRGVAVLQTRQLRAVLRRPDAHLPALGPRVGGARQRAAVGREVHARDGVRVAGEGHELRPALGVPQARRRVRGRGRQAPAVRAPVQAMDGARVSRQLRDQPPLRHAPEAHSSVGAGRGEPRAVGGPGHGVDLAAPGLEPEEARVAGGLEQAPLPAAMLGRRVREPAPRRSGVAAPQGGVRRGDVGAVGAEGLLEGRGRRRRGLLPGEGAGGQDEQAQGGADGRREEHRRGRAGCRAGGASARRLQAGAGRARAAGPFSWSRGGGWPGARQK